MTPTCRGCHARIRWITTRNGRPMPVDPEKLSEWVTAHARSGARKLTLVAADGAMLTGWQASVITPGSRSIEGYLPHWASCPQAQAFKHGAKP